MQRTSCKTQPRSRQRLALAFGLSLLLAVATLSSTAIAFDTGQTKTEHGISVYVGALPAEIVRGHPKSHPEAAVHGGPPRGQHVYHLVVAIFDAASGARITDAKVTARIASLGLGGTQKPLEPMTIADTVTYGNYFNLPDKGRYRISLQIARPQGVVDMSLDYEH